MGLFLVATPIGNLGDFSFRAVEVLRSCDYILCEDTRHSRTLFKHYQIEKPLKSYHKFNEAAREDEVITDLKSGSNIALVSDAGTPGIADPGERLVRRCIEEGVTVTPIPGACALIAALSASGLPTQPFQFIGFVPRRRSQLTEVLQQLLTYQGTSICYESPQRLQAFLALFDELAPTRQVVVARELTKKFEEIRRGTARELSAHWQETPKGEIVILIAPPEPGSMPMLWEEMTLQEHVIWMESSRQLSRSEAIKAVAEARSIPKKVVYRAVHVE